MKRYAFEACAALILTTAVTIIAYITLFDGSFMRNCAAIAFSLIFGMCIKRDFKHFFTAFCAAAVLFAADFFILRAVLQSGGSNAYYLEKLGTQGSAFMKMYSDFLKLAIRSYCGAAAVYGLRCTAFSAKKDNDTTVI